MNSVVLSIALLLAVAQTEASYGRPIFGAGGGNYNNAYSNGGNTGSDSYGRAGRYGGTDGNSGDNAPQPPIEVRPSQASPPLPAADPNPSAQQPAEQPQPAVIPNAPVSNGASPPGAAGEIDTTGSRVFSGSSSPSLSADSPPIQPPSSANTQTSASDPNSAKLVPDPPMQ